MAEIYFGDFRVVVNRHIKEIEADNPESHSIEWFLLKYLRRIVKYADGSGYGLHEVYCKDEDTEDSMTKEPASFAGDNSQEVQDALFRAHVDSIERKVFEEPESWSE